MQDISDLFMDPITPSTDDDIFAGPANDFHRDQWGRPIIAHPETGEPTPYTRISTLSGYASSGFGINFWKTQHTAAMVANNDDLAAMIRSLGAEYYKHPKMREACKIAEARAQLDIPANWGTAIHGFTEPGKPLLCDPPVRIRPELDWYENELARTGIMVETTEINVVNDRFRCAGSFDHLYRMPDGMYWVNQLTGEIIDLSGAVIVGDKKTGQKLHPLQVAVQTALYTTSERYDVVTRTRSQIHPDLDTRVGLDIHVPLGNTGDAVFGFLDLTLGLKLAAACSILHAYSTAKNMVYPVPTIENKAAMAVLESTETMEDLVRICTCGGKPGWTRVMDGLLSDQWICGGCGLPSRATAERICLDIPRWIEEAKTQQDLSMIWQTANTLGLWTSAYQDLGMAKLKRLTS